MAFALSAVALVGSVTLLESPVRAGPPEPAADAHGLRNVRVVDFEGEIEPALAAYTIRQIAEARKAGADGLILRIESPGGRVDSSMEVADALLALPKSLRTIAWVPEYAYSGASMVALACDEIVMRPGARIGDCQPILMGEGGIIPAGEKMETVLRAEFRRFAERNGWPPLLAEKLVSKDLEVVEVREDREGARPFFVSGGEFESARDDDRVGGKRKADLLRLRVVVPKDRLLTMTTEEAQSLGFVRRTFDRERELLAAVAAPGAAVVQVGMSPSEKASRWLLQLVGVLGGLVVLCFTLTLFQGVGIATFIGLVALILTVLMTVTADLPQGFPIFLIALGVLLIAAEVFLIPGFGFVGIAGIVCAASGFLALSTGFTLTSSGTLTWATAGSFVLQFSLAVLVGGAFLVFLSRVFPSLPFVRRRLLLPVGGLPAGAAILPTDHPALVGEVGAAQTDLRPAGRARLAGRSFDVTSEGGFVEAGTPVRVVRVEGLRVMVRAATAAPDAPAPTLPDVSGTRP